MTLQATILARGFSLLRPPAALAASAFVLSWSQQSSVLRGDGKIFQFKICKNNCPDKDVERTEDSSLLAELDKEKPGPVQV